MFDKSQRGHESVAGRGVSTPTAGSGMTAPSPLSGPGMVAISIDPVGVAVGSLRFAEVLDGRDPGLGLVGLLDPLVPGELHEAALVEAIAAWERVGAWAAARQGELIADLAARRERQGFAEYVDDEIATRLACTRTLAQGKVALAFSLGALPSIADALGRGLIDVRKATALVDTPSPRPIEDTQLIVDTVLPDAPSLTVPQLKAKIRRIEQELDPGAARTHHDDEREHRTVWMTPAPDAMARLTAYLPADDAMTVYTAIDAIAAAAAVPGDPRGIDARRADALLDVFTRILDTGTGPTGPLPSTGRRRPHLHVTAAATTLLGLDQAPGELAGYGPIPAHLTRAIAADATWQRIFTDPATGAVTGLGTHTYRPGADLTNLVLARDTTCTFPGCRTPAWRCDLDHITPHSNPHGHRGSSSGGGGDSGGGGGSGSGSGGGGGGGGGDDNSTADDAEFETRCENLHALCRHHHRLKTHTTWKVTRDPDTGDTHWTTPTGHAYIRPRASAPLTSAPLTSTHPPRTPTPPPPPRPAPPPPF